MSMHDHLDYIRFDSGFHHQISWDAPWDKCKQLSCRYSAWTRKFDWW